MKRTARVVCWVVVEPAHDVPGQWTAHCLDFDVVTQGNSFGHALEMLCEATTIVLAEDLIAGRDPAKRRAPEECWEPLWLVQSHGRRIGRPTEVEKVAAGLRPGQPFVAAGPIVVTVHVQPHQAAAKRRPCEPMAPFYASRRPTVRATPPSAACC
jgi:hypothetical protein